MRLRYAVTAFGAAIGAVVAVVSHYISHTLPATYYIGSYVEPGSATAQVTSASPVVRPSWWPVLPISVVVGLGIGLGISLLLGRLDYRLVRAQG